MVFKNICALVSKTEVASAMEGLSLGFGCEEIRPHCSNFKTNDFKHYCAAACAGTCHAHMRCTSAIDESVHQIWLNRFVYS